MDIENLLRGSKVRAVDVAVSRNTGRGFLDKVEWEIEEVSWNRSKRTRRGESEDEVDREYREGVARFEVTENV